MKHILTFLFSVLAVTGLRAANPAFTAFLGTNQVVISSNVTTGRIIVGPATPISTIASNAATAINLWTNDNGRLRAVSNAIPVMITGATNATVGGLIISVTTPVASAGTSETNLISVTIPAHTLTNDQDRLTFRASGRFGATSDKRLKVIFGSETILDTGSQSVDGGGWTFSGEIVRSGNTSQSVNADFHGGIEQGALFNSSASLDLSQTNGIATVLKITSTANGGAGDVTNRTMSIWKYIAP